MRQKGGIETISPNGWPERENVFDKMFNLSLQQKYIKKPEDPKRRTEKQYGIVEWILDQKTHGLHSFYS